MCVGTGPAASPQLPRPEMIREAFDSIYDLLDQDGTLRWNVSGVSCGSVELGAVRHGASVCRVESRGEAESGTDRRGSREQRGARGGKILSTDSVFIIATAATIAAAAAATEATTMTLKIILRVYDSRFNCHCYYCCCRGCYDDDNEDNPAGARLPFSVVWAILAAKRQETTHQPTN